MPAAAELTGAAQAVARSQQGVETEARHEHGQQGEAQPPLAQVTVAVVTRADVFV